MNSVPRPEARLIKRGAGRPILRGDWVGLHVRLARSDADLGDDAQVLASTYSASRALRVQVLPGALRPEVLAALLRENEGSTIVVTLEESANPDGEGDLVLEIWVEGVGQQYEPAIEVLATRTVSRAVATPARDRLRELLGQAVKRPTGWVVFIQSDQQELEAMMVQALARGGRPAVHRLAPDASGRVALLLAEQSYQSLCVWVNNDTQV